MAVVPEVPLIPKTGVPLRWFETELPKIGSIYRLTKKSEDERYRIAMPRYLPSKPDIGLLNTWLYCCRAHMFCSPRKPAGATLPYFRAIDCSKSPPMVEELPWSVSYVALSYVCGTTKEPWPKTVLDAVEVTRNMGERYLWVDRFCIPQKDRPEEKSFLISKMDAIYEGADFTIVAAVGDAVTGLAGMSTKARKDQPMLLLKRREKATATSSDPSVRLLGVTTAEQDEMQKDEAWADLHRMGVSQVTILEDQDIEEIKFEKRMMEIFGISEDHMMNFKDTAKDYGISLEQLMPKLLMKEKEFQCHN